MADPAKYVCVINGCGFGAEVVASWKLGRGAELPFTGGKVGSRDGEHISMNLCRRHRIEALAMPNRPYKVMLTAWASKPDKHGLTVTDTGDLLVPGVAVAAKRGGART
jgi:hypothetical protein